MLALDLLLLLLVLVLTTAPLQVRMKPLPDRYELVSV